jgi:hypothetical protein
VRRSSVSRSVINFGAVERDWRLARIPTDGGASLLNHHRGADAPECLVLQQKTLKREASSGGRRLPTRGSIRGVGFSEGADHPTFC